ncbi:MAG: hypothetical protein AMJ45_07175 [Syntrophobacter sp. DG_60]|nr:MAG: hypothetical protein AMJ45_07175 [Syntrophobacter sp. DG_60]
MEIKKILFPTKFRELAFDSLVALTDLKRAGLEEVILLHIIEIEKVGFTPYGGYLKEEEERLREIAKIRFEEWQEVLQKKDINSKVYIEVGRPVGRMLSVAEKEKVDLIVAGRKKRGGLKRLYMGSTMLDLTRSSKLPIMVFKYMADFEREGEVFIRINDRPFERLLVATDWSKPSERALEYVFKFKNLIKQVDVLHVLSNRLIKEEFEKAKIENKEKFKVWASKFEKEGIKASFHVGVGKTADEILDRIETHDTTMIIMGTTGKDSLWKEFWLGSVSHRLAELAEVPVLLIS